MANKIRLRGPDGSDEWADQEAKVGLAHRRLAIVDLTPSGSQPMPSHSGRFVICLNGEIYNHVELRREIQRSFPTRFSQWRGSSDTETLLALIELYGLDSALEKVRGMFALGLWDRAEQKLTLARDRIGEKPLYYGWSGSAFVFASDLKAITAHPEFKREICPIAEAEFLKRNYVPTPLSIYKSVFKLPAATMLQLSVTDVDGRHSLPFSAHNAPRNGFFKHYWSLSDTVADGLDNPYQDDATMLFELDTVLGDVLKMQARADVPVGAFLSGGIDSSLIAALIKHHTGVRPKTYTIGFTESDYDESGHARAVADHLDTDHHELRVAPEHVIDLIPKLGEIYSEPFADSSQLPTYLVSKLARQSVTVALSGDAGDEMFCGYNRYIWTNNVWPMLKPIPFPIRKLASRVLAMPSQKFWHHLSTLPGPLHVPILGTKVQKIANIMRHARDAESLYATLVNEWGDKAISGAACFGIDLTSQENLSDSAKMMYWDACTYLPDDILCKVDRAAMGVSLETRVPLLDHHVIQTAMRLTPAMRIRDGKTKWALRQLLYRHVPPHLIERPKAGFGIPLGHWMKGPLRDWAEDLLDERRLAADSTLNGSVIRQRWQEHLSGKNDWSSPLWGVLMLQAFKRQQSGATAEPIQSQEIAR